MYRTKSETQTYVEENEVHDTALTRRTSGALISAWKRGLTLEYRTSHTLVESNTITLKHNYIETTEERIFVLLQKRTENKAGTQKKKP